MHAGRGGCSASEINIGRVLAQFGGDAVASAKVRLTPEDPANPRAAVLRPVVESTPAGAEEGR